MLIPFIPAIIYSIYKVVLFLTVESKKAMIWLESKSLLLQQKLPTLMIDEDYFKHGINFLELGKNEIAEELFTKAIKINPLPEYYKIRAKVRRLLFDKTGALIDYTKAIKIDPMAYDAYLERGLLNCEMRNYDSAINDWDKAAKLKSETAINLFLNFNGKDGIRDFLNSTKINTAPYKFSMN